MHAAQLWQAEHVAWAARCAVAVVTTTRGRWCHLAWLYPAATALVVLASANHFLLDAAGGLAVAGLGMLATNRPSQLLTRRPTGRLHGRTEAQAQGDADVCYNLSPASDGLRRICRRRQAGGLPAVPGRS